MVLAWHVPYWDRLGWKDPYGDQRHTKRQERYRAALELRGLQTPHLFAGNRPVGSRAALDARVAEETGKPARIGAEATAVLKKGKVSAKVRLMLLDEEYELDEEATLQAVLFQRKAVTKCTAGENEGRTLKEFFVVVASTEPVTADRAIGRPFECSLPAPAGVEADNLGLALLVEVPREMRTLECWHLPVAGSE